MSNYPPSLRRFHIDKILSQYANLMYGKVLDIGGKKLGPRGLFRPPVDTVNEWIYVNNDPKTNPDILTDAISIPLEKSSIDFVVCTELLEYLDEPNLMIKEIKRLLKKDGQGIITVPFMNPIHGDYKYDKARYTKSFLEKLFVSNDLKILKIEEQGSIGSVIYDIIKIQIRENNSKLLGYILHKMLPIFKLIDNLTHKSKRYVHTGYFIFFKKP